MIRPAQQNPGFDFFDQTHQTLNSHLNKLQILVDGVNPSEWSSEQKASAREILEFFENDAKQHHMDEEKIVFPSILRSANAEIQALVERLKQDHGWIETDWKIIEPMLAAAIEGTMMDDDEAMRQAIITFAMLCTEHLLLEETIAYPAAKANWDRWTETDAAKAMQKRRASPQVV